MRIKSHRDSVWSRHRPSFGFLATRLGGTDGVSLETAKWVDVVRSHDCQAYFCAGRLDTPATESLLIPKAFFQHPEILEVQDQLFVEKVRTRGISERVQELKDELKRGLDEFYRRFRFDILVVENALAIPVNIPLGLAITEFVQENAIPVVAHHHDFAWERQRFQSFAAADYLRMAFPPVHPRIQHVVINSVAGHDFGLRTGERWTLVPNVLDFKEMPPAVDDYSSDLRQELSIDEDALLVLQPTRVVPRKGIETAIEIVARLEHPHPTLVISHAAGDEGYAYQQRIEDYARFLGVDLRIVADRVGDHRAIDDHGRKTYTLWDVYPHADLITYPSLYEGFGNAFVEAIYFRKPIVVNRYEIFEADIEPYGFDVISFTHFVTDRTLDHISEVLEGPGRRSRMAETNYMLGWRYLSYEMLEEKLEGFLVNLFGS